MENEEMGKSNPNLYDFIETMAEQILQRLDDIERVLQGIVPKSTIKVEYLNGERLYNNSQLCEMLGKSKRSLQRYRSEGSLPYVMYKHSTHYRESDVENFKRVLIAEFEERKRQQKSTKDDAT